MVSSFNFSYRSASIFSIRNIFFLAVALEGSNSTAFLASRKPLGIPVAFVGGTTSCVGFDVEGVFVGER